jgi:hypothetical protein
MLYILLEELSDKTSIEVSGYESNICLWLVWRNSPHYFILKIRIEFCHKFLSWSLSPQFLDKPLNCWPDFRFPPRCKSDLRSYGFFSQRRFVFCYRLYGTNFSEPFYFRTALGNSTIFLPFPPSALSTNPIGSHQVVWKPINAHAIPYLTV